MSDIDFLANKKPADDQRPKKQADNKEPIAWSEPEKSQPIPKGSGFSPLSFFGKKKEVKAPVVEPKPTIEPKPTVDKDRIRESRQEILRLIKRDESLKPKQKEKQKEQAGKSWLASLLLFLSKKKEVKAPRIYGVEPKPTIEPKPMVDKNKIRESRQEILRSIKRDESLKPKPKEQAGKSWLARLLEWFKKQPSHKEILIDYQQVLSHEKIKRNPPAAPVKPAEPVRPPAKQVEPEQKKSINNQPVPKKKPIIFTPKPKKDFKDSFWGKLFKLIQDKISALKLPKAKPAKINLMEAVKKEAKPKTTEISPPKPPLERAEAAAEIKAKPLKQTEPVQIDKNSPRILATNLIKGEIITFFDWQRKIITLINAILIPTFLIGLIYLGLVYYQKQGQAKMNDQVQKFNELTETIKQEEAGLKDITEFQSRLKIVSQIFAKHIYWTNLFKFLEDNTIKDVYYAGFGGDTSGNYSLDAAGLKFSNISDQFDILRNNKKVTSVKTVGGGSTSGNAGDKTGVKFNLDLSISKSIFTE